MKVSSSSVNSYSPLPSWQASWTSKLRATGEQFRAYVRSERSASTYGVIFGPRGSLHRVTPCHTVLMAVAVPLAGENEAFADPLRLAALRLDAGRDVDQDTLVRQELQLRGKRRPQARGAPASVRASVRVDEDKPAATRPE